MSINENGKRCASQLSAIITSFNQGTMVQEALASLLNQSVLPDKIIIVDDGSTDKDSIDILNGLNSIKKQVPMIVHRQINAGVSAARNTGMRLANTTFALILDGDDKLEPTFIETVLFQIRKSTNIVAASSWMKTFGVLESIVCPTGGNIKNFLSHNCCPATHIVRCEVWRKCGGYDETMRTGFEDWDYFLRLLEISPKTHIKIVEEALIDYRTVPASSNIRSMDKRLELMKYLMEKHARSYAEHMIDVMLDLEAISISRLYGWESEIKRQIFDASLSDASKNFMESPSYGDGGMAAAVRIASQKQAK